MDGDPESDPQLATAVDELTETLKSLGYPTDDKNFRASAQKMVEDLSLVSGGNRKGADALANLEVDIGRFRTTDSHRALVEIRDGTYEVKADKFLDKVTAKAKNWALAEHLHGEDRDAGIKGTLDLRYKSVKGKEKTEDDKQFVKDYENTPVNYRSRMTAVLKLAEPENISKVVETFKLIDSKIWNVPEPDSRQADAGTSATDETPEPPEPTNLSAVISADKMQELRTAVSGMGVKLSPEGINRNQIILALERFTGVANSTRASDDQIVPDQNYNAQDYAGYLKGFHESQVSNLLDKTRNLDGKIEGLSDPVQKAVFHTLLTTGPSAKFAPAHWPTDHKAMFAAIEAAPGAFQSIGTLLKSDALEDGPPAELEVHEKNPLPKLTAVEQQQHDNLVMTLMYNQLDPVVIEYNSKNPNNAIGLPPVPPISVNQTTEAQNYTKSLVMYIQVGLSRDESAAYKGKGPEDGSYNSQIGNAMETSIGNMADQDGALNMVMAPLGGQKSVSVFKQTLDRVYADQTPAAKAKINESVETLAVNTASIVPLINAVLKKFSDAVPGVIAPAELGDPKNPADRQAAQIWDTKSGQSLASTMVALKLGLIRDGIDYKGPLDGTYSPQIGQDMLKAVDAASEKSKAFYARFADNEEKTNGKENLRDQMFARFDVLYTNGIITDKSGQNFTVSNFLDGMDRPHRVAAAGMIVESAVIEIAKGIDEELVRLSRQVKNDGNRATLADLKINVQYQDGSYVKPDEVFSNADKDNFYRALSYVKFNLGFTDGTHNGEYGPKVKADLIEKLQLPENAETLQKMGGMDKAMLFFAGADELLKNDMIDGLEGAEIRTAQEEKWAKIGERIPDDIKDTIRNFILSSGSLGTLLIMFLEIFAGIPISKILGLEDNKQIQETKNSVLEGVTGPLEDAYKKAVAFVGTDDPEKLKAEILDASRKILGDEKFKAFEKPISSIFDDLKNVASGKRPEAFAKKVIEIFKTLPKSGSDLNKQDAASGGVGVKGISYNPGANTLGQQEIDASRMPSDQAMKALWAEVAVLHQTHVKPDETALYLEDTTSGHTLLVVPQGDGAPMIEDVTKKIKDGTLQIAAVDGVRKIGEIRVQDVTLSPDVVRGANLTATVKSEKDAPFKENVLPITPDLMGELRKETLDSIRTRNKGLSFRDHINGMLKALPDGEDSNPQIGARMSIQKSLETLYSGRARKYRRYDTGDSILVREKRDANAPPLQTAQDVPPTFLIVMESGEVNIHDLSGTGITDVTFKGRDIHIEYVKKGVLDITKRMGPSDAKTDDTREFREGRSVKKGGGSTRNRYDADVKQLPLLTGAASTTLKTEAEYDPADMEPRVGDVNVYGASLSTQEVMANIGMEGKVIFTMHEKGVGLVSRVGDLSLIGDMGELKKAGSLNEIGAQSPLGSLLKTALTDVYIIETYGEKHTRSVKKHPNLPKTNRDHVLVSTPFLPHFDDRENVGSTKLKAEVDQYLRDFVSKKDGTTNQFAQVAGQKDEKTSGLKDKFGYFAHGGLVLNSEKCVEYNKDKRAAFDKGKDLGPLEEFRKSFGWGVTKVRMPECEVKTPGAESIGVPGTTSK